MVPGKMVSEKWSQEKWSPEKWFLKNKSPEKCASKTVLRQKNARKFKRLFHFYQSIPLRTQKMFDAHVTILHMYQTVEH